MPEKNRVVIIGAGIGGLSLGIYLRLNRYETKILEMGHESGGVSVSWKRGEYIFDGATNWVPGTSPGTSPHKILNEIVDIEKLSLSEPEYFEQVEYRDKLITIYNDPEKLRQEMERIAPEDKGVIDEFITGVKDFSKANIPMDVTPSLMSIREKVWFLFKNLRNILLILKWRRNTIDEFSERFRNSDLRRFIKNIFPSHSYFSMMGVMVSLGWMCAKSAAYPEGGSNSLIDNIEQRYLSLGGELEFNRRVTEIVVESGRAKGVRCSDGTFYESDRVVSTADGYNTLFSMLQGKYVTKRMKKRYESMPVFPSIIQLSYGVSKEMSDYPTKIVYLMDKELIAGKDRFTSMIIRVCSFDPGFAPEGSTSVIVQLRPHDWEYWYRLRSEDREMYETEKERVSSEIKGILDTRFEGFSASIESEDVCTPATYIRYTGVYKGSYQGWAPVPEMIGHDLEKELPGLKGFYMGGQWVWP
ncbi:MAG: phytoene desaturase family protein, partial [Chitinivibrionales bacterium]